MGNSDNVYRINVDLVSGNLTGWLPGMAIGVVSIYARAAAPRDARAMVVNNRLSFVTDDCRYLTITEYVIRSVRRVGQRVPASNGLTIGEMEIRHRHGACAWFALCENEATGTMPNPALGEVPICARCKAKVDAMRADS